MGLTAGRGYPPVPRTLVPAPICGLRPGIPSPARRNTPAIASAPGPFGGRTAYDRLA